MHKETHHHHHCGHHPHGEVSGHHNHTPGKCEEDNGDSGNNPGCPEGGRFGIISFQSNSSHDIFHVLELRKDNVELSDESLIGVKEIQFDSDKPWVTGNVPQLIPVNVEGDTAQVHALIRGECFDCPFRLRVYLEYEESETLIVEDSRPKKDERERNPDPKEVHL